MVKIVYAHDGINVCDELFLSFLKNKYDVCVLTFHPTSPYVPPGIRIIRIPDPIPDTNLHPFKGARKHMLTPIRALFFRKYASQIKPDVVIGCWATTYGFYAAYSNLHPFVLFVWGSDVLISPWKYVPLRTLAKYSLKRADLVVLDSDIQEKAAIRLGCAGHKILKFPWVDLNGFESNIKQGIKIRKRLGWTIDDVAVISTRAHRPIYGVNQLIEAIPHVTRQKPKVKFLILGEGELTEKFREQVKMLKVNDSVKFLGNVPHRDVVKYLNAANIYVSTSFSDGASASLLEAMACGLSPVVTDIPGNKEWIKDGWNGYLVPTSDPLQLAQKILLLAENGKIRQKIRTKAVETVKARVNWQRNMTMFDNTITKMISEKI